MTIASILDQVPPSRRVSAVEPGCFRDLHLDRVVEIATGKREGYALKPLFYRLLRDPDAIAFRQAVCQDCERTEIAACLGRFAEQMRLVRTRLGLAEKLYEALQRQRWHLAAARGYIDAVTGLTQELEAAGPASRGLIRVKDDLARYIRTSAFAALETEIGALEADLARVQYRLHIEGTSIEITAAPPGADYSLDVEATFARFKQGAVKDYRIEFPAPMDVNSVEGRILQVVALQFTEVLNRLDRFVANHLDIVDPAVAAFDREIQFYLTYLGYIAPLRGAGLPFAYPRVVPGSEPIRIRDTFDLDLARKLTHEGQRVVSNDVTWRDPERILVITGPNQGGKTTYTRAIGQVFFLAALGLPVAGSAADVTLIDNVLTHFERQEHLDNLRGKLQDDLIRIHAILSTATSASLILLNEIFASTTLNDAIFLGRRVLERVEALGALGVCVTFVDELAALSPATVSLVSMVEPENPERRTFKILRRPADGQAYALSIAARHGLTYEQLLERLGS